MRSGDVLVIDFGVTMGSAPAFVRPCVVLTADAVLQNFTSTFHVVPLTTNAERRWSTDVPIGDVETVRADSVAQCHLVTVVSRLQVMEHGAASIGPVNLARIRSVVGDLLDIAT